MQFSFSESSTLPALPTLRLKLSFGFKVALPLSSSGSAPTGNLPVIYSVSPVFCIIIIIIQHVSTIFPFVDYCEQLRICSIFSLVRRCMYRMRQKSSTSIFAVFSAITWNFKAKILRTYLVILDAHNSVRCYFKPFLFACY